jgi:AcrR family transcriptional regulator
MPREPRHQKVTQEQYFQAALARLAGHGAEGLTIGALCGELGVTSGSFYHYFGNWDSFVDALLRHWEAEQTDRVAALAATQPGAERRLAWLRREASVLPHEAEAAIRAWSRGEERVRLAQERVDARRAAELRALVLELGVDPRDADRLATMGLALLVGVQQLHRPVDVELLFAVFGDFAETIRRHVRPPAPAGAAPAGAAPGP